MYLIGNWKQNKTVDEALSWLQEFSFSFNPYKNNSDVLVIMAPSFVLIPKLAEKIKELNLNIKLAAQTVSKFESGSHTGEVSAFQLKAYVDYVIVGHSERKQLKEKVEDTLAEIEMVLKNELQPIVCFSDLAEFNFIKNQTKAESFEKLIFAYEPVSAIGTKKPATISDIENIKNQTGLSKLIYGGSVDPTNIEQFLRLDYLNGFLVGSASLNSENFFSLFKKLCV